MIFASSLLTGSVGNIITGATGFRGSTGATGFDGATGFTGSTGVFNPYEAVNGNITVIGSISATNAIYSTTGLEIGGSNDTAVLFVDTTKIGINTETPNETLTVFGNISASGTIYAGGQNLEGATGPAGATGPVGAYSMWTLTDGGVIGNTDNSTEYICKFNNIVLNSDTAVLSAGGNNGNIEIKQTGLYIVDYRYSTYDLSDSSDTLGLWIRGSNSEITTGSGGTRLRRSIRSDALDNDSGSYSAMFTTTLRVESVPYFIAGTFLHTGAQGGGGNQGYPNTDDPQYRPYLLVHKLRDL